MDENTDERGGQVSALATTSLREESSGLNERSYAEPQQTGSSGDGAAQQHHTSISDATNPLHSDASHFNDRSDAVPQENVPSSTTATHLTHPGSPSKSFLDLPPEIRNMIYCCVFPKGEAAVELLARHSGKGYIAMSDRLHLLYTCRQIYEETTSLLQAARRFKVVQPRSLRYLIGGCLCVTRCYHNYANDILRHIIPQEGLFFDYDMDRGTVNKNFPALFYVNQCFRDRCLNRAPHLRFSAHTSTSSTDPISASFGSLRSWLKHGPVDLFSYKDDHPSIETSVILNFRMNAMTRLEDVRFEMNSFSDAIVRDYHFRDELNADLMVRIESPGRPVAFKKKHIVEVLMDSLLYMRKVIIEHPELGDERCPKILIDGQFRVREARFSFRNGNTLELTNEESFWEIRHNALKDKWEDMILAGLEIDESYPEPKPEPNPETINNETFEGGILELQKRLVDCYRPVI